MSEHEKIHSGYAGGAVQPRTPSVCYGSGAYKLHRHGEEHFTVPCKLNNVKTN